MRTLDGFLACGVCAVLIYYIYVLPGAVVAIGYGFHPIGVVLGAIPLFNWLPTLGALTYSGDKPEVLEARMWFFHLAKAGLAIPFIIAIPSLLLVAAEKSRKRREERLVHARATLALELTHRNAELALFNEMQALRTRLAALSQRMSERISSARNELDQAERNLTSTLFSPFWENIEHAAKELANYDQDIRQASEIVARHSQLSRDYRGPSPVLSLNHAATEPDRSGISLALRLQSLARTAQQDFRFAMIYEQRKTSHVLIDGFSDMAQAIDQMSDRLTGSIARLAASIGLMSTQLDDWASSQKCELEGLADEVRQNHGELIDEIRNRQE